MLGVIIGFLITGYLISGRLGGMDENKALTLHKLMHLPLLALLGIHVLPACYLAFRRWGWIKRA